MGGEWLFFEVGRVGQARLRYCGDRGYSYRLTVKTNAGIAQRLVHRPSTPRMSVRFRLPAQEQPLWCQDTYMVIMPVSEQVKGRKLMLFYLL